jgi:hypothetical protein
MEGQTTQAIRKITLLSDGLCCLSFHLPFFLMAVILSVLPFTLLFDGQRRVNGRTDNTNAIIKKGKWKDRQHKPSERRVNERTDNTMAIRKKGKSKDRLVLSVLPFTLLYDGICIVCPSIYPPF